MLTKSRKVASGGQRWGGGPLFLASNNFLKFTYKNELTWCWPSPPPTFCEEALHDLLDLMTHMLLKAIGQEYYS